MPKFYYTLSNDSLLHHGIKGQEWGHRRFQNPDGSLTPEGVIRYSKYRKEKAQEGRRKGAKIGGLAGAAIGAAKIVPTLALGASLMPAYGLVGVPVGVAVTASAYLVGKSAVKGAIVGATIGNIKGSISAKKGMDWIHQQG